MEEEPITPEETALRDTLNIFAYEIEKNERQIMEWEHTVTMNSAEATSLQRLIADARMRIARLKERWLEVEEQEENYRRTEHVGPA